MAEFTHIDLRRAREKQNMPRWKLGSEIGVSEDTIERWESGKQIPWPDDVGKIEQALNARNDHLWHRWMMSTFDSYRERYVEIQKNEHPSAVVTGTEIAAADLLAMLEPTKRDSIDGCIDDAEQLERLKEQARKTIAALQQVIDLKPH